MVYFCYNLSLNVCVSYIFFVLDSHLATLWESNCLFGFLLVMFPLGLVTRDVRNELLIVLLLDIHVGHDKNQYIPV